MRRREFISLLGGAAAAWPFAARAQQSGLARRIGVLMTTAESDPEGQARVTAFLKGLQELGWSDGRNLRVEYRWYEGDVARAKTYATELVRLMPDLILANGTPALAAVKSETRMVPVVFAMVPDPLGQGFVPSQAHPGGNITGFTQFDYPIGEKWLEVLKEIAPAVTRVFVLHNPDEFQSSGFLRVISAVAPSLGVEMIPTAVHDAAEIERVSDVLAREPKGGLLVVTSPLTTVHRELIVALAGRHRVPAVYPYRFFTAIGGLVSYGVDNIDLFRRAASYVDRILRGERAGDLPVQAPTKYEFIINLKTAKALGLTVPPSLLAIADEVIE